jgi:hypothetical protein
MLLLTLISLVVLLSARIIWQGRPNELTCGLFWGVAAAVIVAGWTWDISQGFFVAGVACNAAVTLANGGFMPVASHRRLAGPARSVWVQREDAKHLLFLGDNWGNNHIRFSVGDTLLLAGIVLTFFAL